MKAERLIGHHAQFGGDCACLGGERGGKGVHAIRGAAAVAASANEQEARIVFQLVGLDNGQPVLPDGAIDFFFGQPGLRGKVHHVGRITRAGDGADHFEFIVWIRGFDIAVQGRFSRQERNRGKYQ
jgi:hypothetical protein